MMLEQMKRKKILKKVMASTIAAAMMCSTLSGFKLEVQAATSDKMDVSAYKSGETWTAPTKEGQVFAGWYTDETYKTPYMRTTGEAYAKFVDADVLSVKKQLKLGVSHDVDTTDVRFLTSVDTLDYQSVGFSVNVVGTTGTSLKEVDLQEKSAYTTVLAGESQVATDAKTTFCEESNYFVVHTLTGVPNNAFDGGFTVTPYWYTLDGTKVEGTTATFTIRDTIGVPEEDAEGFDGTIAAWEYSGAKLTNVSGDGNYRIAVQGKLTTAGNIRLAVTVDAKTTPDTVVNTWPGMSQYLFSEFRFGENNGENGTLVKANVLGQTENAVMKRATKDNGESAEYRYTTEMELWIPKSAITNDPDTTPDSANVKLTRAVLWNNAGGGTIWHVAKWANLNNCSITANGIQLEIPSDAVSGVDGEISEGEYQGSTLEATSTNGNYKISVQGKLTDAKDIRLAVTVGAKTAPDKVVNNFAEELSQYLFAEIGFGDNNGNGTCTLVKANVLGDAENAKTVVQTTEGSEYPYSTVIELWIPKNVITYNTDVDNVRITRLALFHNIAEGDAGENWLVAKFVDLNNCTITANGIKKEGEVDVPADVDGVISAGEYQGDTLESISTKSNYKISVQGKLTAEKDIRLAVTVNTNVEPNTVVNGYPDLSQYLFAEIGFGENNGNGDCTLVKANVLGQAENAVAKAKTTNNGVDADYLYTTVIEMYVPQSSITNNTYPDKVRMTRLFLFHEKDTVDPGINFVVAKFASLYPECIVTADGIKKEGEGISGMDGVIAPGEYKGEVVSKASGNNKLSVQGHLTEEKNIRLAVTIDANTHPDTTVNSNNILGNYLFAGFYFGDGDGYSDDIWANVRGDSQNVLQTAVKTTDNGEGAAYRYTTVIEMLVSKSAIHNSSNEDDVRFARAVLYNATFGDIYLLAYFAGDLPKCGITADGIYYK